MAESGTGQTYCSSSPVPSPSPGDVVDGHTLARVAPGEADVGDAEADQVGQELVVRAVTDEAGGDRGCELLRGRVPAEGDPLLGVAQPREVALQQCPVHLLALR